MGRPAFTNARARTASAADGVAGRCVYPVDGLFLRGSENERHVGRHSRNNDPTLNLKTKAETMIRCERCGDETAAVFRPDVALCKPCFRDIRVDEMVDNEIPNGPMCGDCGRLDCVHLAELRRAS